MAYCNLSCYACNCSCEQSGTHPDCSRCRNCKDYDNHSRKA